MSAMSSAWYDATRNAATIPTHVAERAVEWLIELQSETVSADVITAWQQWREAHPDHERAWKRIESVRGKLQPLASPVEASIAQAALTPPASPARRRTIKTLAVLLFAGGGTWGALHSVPWQRWSADYRTSVGERRTLALADGTQLVMNTGSAIDIALNEHERRVRLIAGEILITTAPDPQQPARPFLVETAQGTARALGTRYTVREWDGGTHVSVYQGAVELRPSREPSRSLVLQAGRHASYTADTISPPIDVPSREVAWAEGFIVARSMRLADFVAELARYSDTSLSCDPRVADLRVSGSFPLDDVGKVLDTLGTTLAVRTDSVTRFWGAREIRLVPA
ncbi:histidine kinase [Pandoraea pneumonica]|jgi:transmembrane sensor|uniref:Histidine kinase n=1 Tax=Pandoraea pneumonica TaxID=2508299 RepID=A0A5E4TWV0_9BURK|nr:FecR family protein [Pandoraea pneumonica]VVD92426.1 histidine kinase [Pandoraea pneumonica]